MVHDRKDAILFTLVGIFTSSLVISNVLATKIFVMGSIFMPAGVIAYPITFLMTDVIGEIWGKKAANRVVWAGFFCSILTAFLGLIAVHLPPAPFFQNQESFSRMFGMVGRITLASLVAYLASQMHDVWAFHWLKEKTQGKHLWLRNNVATIASQMIDTVLFISIAFWGVIPTGQLLPMMLGQWSIKVLLALLDTPFCYLLVGWLQKMTEETKNCQTVL